MKKILILAVSLIIVFNSFSQKIFNDEQIKKYLPKKDPKYKLAEDAFCLLDSSVISVNTIYIRTTNSERYENTSYYTYLRFFEDGRVFFSFSYLSFPTQKELNDFSYGKYGRYIIQTDSIITVELYQDKYTGIEFLHAKKIENGIQFFSHGCRNPKWIFNKRDRTGGYYMKKW